MATNIAKKKRIKRNVDYDIHMAVNVVPKQKVKINFARDLQETIQLSQERSEPR